MKSITVLATLCCVLMLNASAIAQHLHVSTDLVPGAGGGQKLDVMTYGDVQTFQGAGRLLSNPDGSPFVYLLASEPVSSDPFAGFITGKAMTLTTDFYDADSPTNPLHGADIWYEFMSVAAVNGLPNNVIGYSVPPDVGVIYQDALTNGSTIAERSVMYGVGNHFHGVSLYSAFAGMYNVSVRAVDVNGLFQPSEPVTFRVNAVVPEPGSIAFIAIACLVSARRRRT